MYIEKDFNEEKTPVANRLLLRVKGKRVTEMQNALHGRNSDLQETQDKYNAQITKLKADLGENANYPHVERLLDYLEQAEGGTSMSYNEALEKMLELKSLVADINEG